ncbi:hypothetical protein TNCV_2932541 [Trichonephila clavipes]|nr:hypothetical protein TNCV_2932541 [Trichonephila clavipes]
MDMKRMGNVQMLPKVLHELKYEAINVPKGPVRLLKKAQERKCSICYLLITKGGTSSSPDRVVVYSASTPQVWGSINGLRKVDSAFNPRYIGSIIEYQACFGSQALKVSLQTDHQIGTSVHAPQRPMVTCIMMSTVVPGPHGLLCL